MQICGIVAEFNPFHNGHQYIINKFKTKDNCILSVMSGNYVQRGEPSLFPKHIRAEAALNCGVDLVIELPSPWSSSCAQNFAFGAISLMKNCGVDKVVFGAESDDIAPLLSIAEADRTLKLDDADLKSGKPYAQIRQEALSQRLDTDCSQILNGANNNLGVEYLKSMADLNYEPRVETVKRRGAEHDSDHNSDNICSASHLRNLITAETQFQQFVPSLAAKKYTDSKAKGKITDYNYYERELLSYLRRVENFKELPDIAEGIDNKIAKAVKSCNSYDELLQSVKSKRYTLARIRRILLSAYLQHNKNWFLKEVPYINVLGFTKNGEVALKQISNNTSLPIVVSCKSNKPMDPAAQQLLEQECKRNDIYMSLLNSPSPCGSDHTTKIIKTGV